MKANQTQRPNYEHIGLEMKAQFMTSLAASFTRWRRIWYLCSKKMTYRITEKFVILNTFMHTLNYIIFSILPCQLRDPRVVILNAIYNHFTITNQTGIFFLSRGVQVRGPMQLECRNAQQIGRVQKKFFTCEFTLYRNVNFFISIN